MGLRVGLSDLPLLFGPADFFAAFLDPCFPGFFDAPFTGFFDGSFLVVFLDCFFDFVEVPLVGFLDVGFFEVEVFLVALAVFFPAFLLSFLAPFDVFFASLAPLFLPAPAVFDLSATFDLGPLDFEGILTSLSDFTN